MSAAEDLFDDMCRSKAGWTAKDLETLYLGFGFRRRDGGKHVVYSHPKYPSLRTTVTRSHTVPVGYVQTAIRLVRTLRELDTASERGTRPP
jgi:predicted RNA binding protein YcfA (HicA-like mRNA interferase family)